MNRHVSYIVLSLCLAVGVVALAEPAALHAQDAAGSTGLRRSPRVLVVEPAGEARLARSMGAQARDRAIATLGARGFTAARGPAGCAEPDCATELLRGGAAEHALAMALWGRTRCDRVAVTLVDAQGIAHSGEVAVSGTDVNAAIDGAIDAALAHLASGGSSILQVSGSPEGATITLDQIPWGTLPHEDRVPHGERQLAVSADGFVTDRRSVTVGTSPVSVEIALERAEAEPAESDAPPAPAEVEHTAPATQPSAGPDVVLLGVGGAVAGVGVGLLVPGIYGFAAGDGAPSPELVYERTNVPVSAAFLGVGAAAIVGGVVLLVLGATSGGSTPARTDLSRGILLRF